MLTGINARYVHTNLAIRYLAAALDPGDHLVIREYTINHDAQEIVRQIYEECPDIVGFSCYIWNIGMILHITSCLKKILPEMVIVLGGPEVSYETEKLMKRNDSIDLCIAGEGERSFRALVELLSTNGDYTTLPGLAFRARGQVHVNRPDVHPLQAEEIPLPYSPDAIFDTRQIYYYEASRGCPFRCQFCLSGNEGPVVQLPLDRVFRDLELFIRNPVKQVKFVDRTFNADPKRAMAIWHFLKEKDNGFTNFHFEMNATLLNEEMMTFLASVPAGLFQFEIGVQTTNPETLKAIQRPADQEKGFQKIRKLQEQGRIHLHVDLIAGLPCEDYFSFRQSFNDVFALQTDMVQLGFLKLLKGSGLRRQEMDFGYVYDDDPPYEVLATNDVSFGELLVLKQIEEVLERFWNSGRFRHSIKMAWGHSGMDAFTFFKNMGDTWRFENHHAIQPGAREQICFLQNWMHQKCPLITGELNVALRFDLYLSGHQNEMPESLRQKDREEQYRKMRHDLLHTRTFVEAYLPEALHQPAKRWISLIDVLAVPGNMSVNHRGDLAVTDKPFLADQEKYLVFIYPKQKQNSRNRTRVIDLKEAYDESSIHKS